MPSKALQPCGRSENVANVENVASSNVANGQWGGLAGAEARWGFAGVEARHPE